MDYLYENLGDERFQEFCHALINKEFPHSQAFPVGQPDGGRDTVVYSMKTSEKEFDIYQVKYVRNVNNVKDPHKWLVEILKDETKKVRKLIPKGAKNYYLITNVRGTAHSDVGSIDQVNKILEEVIEIPAICWWRDDISRKLESEPLLMWSYPEIISGRDILNSVTFHSLNEKNAQRENVVKSYLADQYDADREVKFKQIELQNNLLDLFTDVPIRLKKFNSKDRKLRSTLEKFVGKMPILGQYEPEEKSKIGAAAFLLNSNVQNDLERILLEGGPGQGKSTISQYICQVHRIRLLEKYDDINLLPSSIKDAPIKLPFKIDLRDIASWVEKRNPYPGSINEEHFSRIWNKSLESFLLGHIFYHSKIEDFNSNDLLDVFKSSSILIVFDGFDEIANIKLREEIIDFINRGMNRLRINSGSIQIIITSRPAAFYNSIGFSEDLYPHFELTDVTPIIINEYLEKWIKSKKLDSRQASEIRKLVEEKLQMPHLRDLAKSPMQLAIFISLLNIRGESLPNKRTALYDSYIELFFNREAEKNSTVRDKRDLIIDIHQYLAWLLHSEAEQYKNSGRIEITDLKDKLKEYLKKKGHEVEIADKLFDILNERVCAIVSRVQGTFEFEVQPLREYFCAKYLYRTAAYSPAGLEISGTKTQRFDGIARNFYWQNVVRFFAGCFDQGELPMLIDRLNELIEDESLKYTNYPRIITSQLLSDYVFTQYPKLLKQVVKTIIEGINVGLILNQNKAMNNEFLVLPDECGRVEIVNECFQQLKKFPPPAFATELIAIIINNPHKIIEQWKSFLTEISKKKLTKWLEYAYLLRIIYMLDKETLLSIIFEDEAEKNPRLEFLIFGNRLDIVDSDSSLKKNVFDLVLDKPLYIPFRSSNSLASLACLLHPFHLCSIAIGDVHHGSFINYLTSRVIRYSSQSPNTKSITEFSVTDEIDSMIKELCVQCSAVFDLDIAIWQRSIETWDTFVESARNIFNEKWSLYIIAIIASSVKTGVDKFEGFENINDSSLSLCKRAKFARLRSTNLKYWEMHLIETSKKDLNFVLLAFFSLAAPSTIITLFNIASEAVNSLKPNDLMRLIMGCKHLDRLSPFKSAQQTSLNEKIKLYKDGDLTKYLISLRFTGGVRRREFIHENFDKYSGNFEEILRLKLEYLLDRFYSSPHSEKVLDEIKDLYSKVKGSHDDLYFYRRSRYSDGLELPIGLAKKIMLEPQKYPNTITTSAEKSCRIYANRQMKPVGDIAKREKWFVQMS